MKTPGTLHLEHRYAHAPDRVWRALTTPALLARWWGAGDIRAEVGHRFEVDMGPWGRQPCEVVAVDEGRMLRFRFATTSLDTVITWSLAADGDGTVLTLTHEGFDLDSPMGVRAFEGMKSGWPAVVARIAPLLDG